MIGESSFRDVRCVVFDVYGTLAEIEEKRRPYGQLLELLRASGRTPQPDDAARLMSSDLNMADLPKALFDVDLPAADIEKLEADLQTELKSIRLYPEVPSTLSDLHNKGIKIGLCSNLATPYADPIKQLLPFELDAYAWSFEVGVVKPEAEIYAQICRSLGCSPEHAVMVGDTPEADFYGPRRAGMRAILLNRKHEAAAEFNIKSLDEITRILHT